jgi:hypothetical protein
LGGATYNSFSGESSFYEVYLFVEEYSDMQIARRSIRLVEDAADPQIKFSVLNWLWGVIMLAMIVTFFSMLFT